MDFIDLLASVSCVLCDRRARGKRSFVLMMLLHVMKRSTLARSLWALVATLRNRCVTTTVVAAQWLMYCVHVGCPQYFRIINEVDAATVRPLPVLKVRSYSGSFLVPLHCSV